MSEACLSETTAFNPESAPRPLSKSPYVATAAEAIKNYEENRSPKWYKDNADLDDHNGKYAFQRLRQTCLFLCHYLE